MIAAWMLYLIAASALLAAAAVAGERWALHAGQPTRLPWVLALLLVLGIAVSTADRRNEPAVGTLRAPQRESKGDGEISTAVPRATTRGIYQRLAWVVPEAVPVPSTLSRLDYPLLSLWGLAAVV
ncbi:hypothetical protein [Gemmatimonas sp.]|uniref:hypothetical protein n=2 Tax=Gemmatimonas sp. TaxID=1962908 RepID=UPI003565C430